jgi:hypothetical protein
MVSKVRKKIEGWQGQFINLAGRTVLIKHVLSSIPLHMLAGTPVPKGIFASINSILARFFWADRDDSRHRHWVAWNAVSSTGGLAIRSFQDVAKAMRMKMAWKLVTETSLWSTFFKQKYMQNIHSWYASKRLGCPKLWTEIANVMRSILLNSKWLIGNGNSTSFWYDNWFADCPLIEFALESPEDSPNVAEFVLARMVNGISHLLPQAS